MLFASATLSLASVCTAQIRIIQIFDCFDFLLNTSRQRQLFKHLDQTAKMLIPKADRKKIHEYLFREGVLVAKKEYENKHPDIDTRNLYVVKACQSLTSRGFVKTQFSWQYYYYTLTAEGLDYLREWLHLPAEIVPATHIKVQRSHAPPRGMMGGDEQRSERKPFGGRGGRGGGDRGDRADRGDYRRREGGETKEGAAPGEFAPQFRGGFGRGSGRGGAGGPREEAAPAS
ncbi:40S ribosomal protein S10 [Sclerotinia borealis F-4128]|uniref:40S ribosomal protein S10 n=1 Tax=Sclerotinia borealis (strain F-4128) TaxID=1432307 RepID=W9C043_SCLBF|nr:40S ribosomal protein S10 [Sclerotinia borealis F-4128]